MVKKTNLKKILVVTPSFAGGSWVASEKILDKLSLKSDIFVIGLGNIFRRNKKFSYFSIPYPRYVSWGAIHSKNPLLALLWTLPLSFCFAILVLYKRPSLVITNGFSSSLLLSPVIKMIGANFIVLYHGNILGFMSKNTQKMVRFLSNFVDLVIVNSKGSFDDIKVVIPKEKILVNEHFAEELFFKDFNKNRKRSGVFKISYVGSLNKEKLFYPLVEISRKLRNNKQFNFTFAGIGELQSEIEALSKENSNISYLGYISNRQKLKKLYEQSDVLWSSADETYLTMPAIEALATGTPIIIPKYPALSQKREMRIKIKKSLVPNNIGWLIDTKDTMNCYRLIRNIQKKGIPESMKKNCYEYAKKRYTPANLNQTIKKINFYLK